MSRLPRLSLALAVALAVPAPSALARARRAPRRVVPQTAQERADRDTAAGRLWSARSRIV
jgi:hypothetical protein